MVAEVLDDDLDLLRDVVVVEASQAQSLQVSELTGGSTTDLGQRRSARRCSAHLTSGRHRVASLAERWKQMRPSQIRLCSVMKAELLFGAEKSSKRELVHQKLEVFAGTPRAALLGRARQIEARIAALIATKKALFDGLRALRGPRLVPLRHREARCAAPRPARGCRATAERRRRDRRR